MKSLHKDNECKQKVSRFAHLIKKQESETLVFKWWALEDSNFWHPPCKGGALPTELNALQSVSTRFILT